MVGIPKLGHQIVGKAAVLKKENANENIKVALQTCRWQRDEKLQPHAY